MGHLSEAELQAFKTSFIEKPEQAEHFYRSFAKTLADFKALYINNLPEKKYTAVKGRRKRSVMARTLAEAEDKLERNPSFNGWTLVLPETQAR